MRVSIGRARDRFLPGTSFDLREWSGAFGDVGLLIPIIATLILVNGFNGTSVLLVFGLAYIVSALYYRIPMSVQPLKAMAAIAIAQDLSPQTVSSGALLMGLLLLVLAGSGLIAPVSKLFTRPVVRGIQAAVGVILVKTALEMTVSGRVLQGEGAVFVSVFVEVPAGVLIALPALGIIGVSAWKRGVPASLAVLAFGLVSGILMGAAGGLAGPVPGPDIAAPALPAWGSLGSAFLLLVVPQMPLTIGNATIACADTAKRYYGERAHRVTHRSLLSTMGFANLFAAVFGGVPVCHGAGGVTAHRRFGARTAGAGLIIGSVLLILALGYGSDAAMLLRLIPYPVLGVMLGAVGLQHALLARDCRGVSEAAVAGSVVLVSVLLGSIALGFAAGIALHLALELARKAGQARLGAASRRPQELAPLARQTAAARD